MSRFLHGMGGALFGIAISDFAIARGGWIPDATSWISFAIAGIAALALSVALEKS